MNAWKAAVLLALSAWLASAQGAVSLAGTRLVFDGRFTEASIEARNRSNHDVLLQVWLKDPRHADDSVDAALPFVVTPHLAQLPPQGREQLRLLYQGQGMPVDRESLLHLYVLEIPRRVEGTRQLSIALRQRINVFYRPQDLPGDPALAPQSLLWQRQADRTLRLINPTPFHATLQDVRLGDVLLSDYLLLAPGASHDWPLPAGAAVSHATFKALTDYGGQRSYCVRLGEPATPTQSLQHDKEHC